MEDIIKLKSRGEIHNYLKKIKKADGSDSKTYVLKTDSPTLRVGYIDVRHKFIDPSGGPMIVEGSFLPEANAEVKDIIFVQGCGHTITFK